MKKLNPSYPESIVNWNGFKGRSDKARGVNGI